MFQQNFFTWREVYFKKLKEKRTFVTPNVVVKTSKTVNPPHPREFNLWRASLSGFVIERIWQAFAYSLMPP